MNEHLESLKKYCNEYDVMVYVFGVLNDFRFQTWSGSGKNIHHHYGDGGLLTHTGEVVMYCFDIATRHNAMNLTDRKKINIQELLISAVWHDYGKIWDYQRDENGVWGKYDKHARQIHHISRSVIEWEKYVDKLPTRLWKALRVRNIDPDNVTHNILAHHGMREWGSPVAPATREAWILHLADNLSARLDDCDRCDVIKH